MERAPRILGIAAVGGALVASHVIGYQSSPHERFGLADALHFSFPVIIYVFANLLIDEGRARERGDRERADREKLLRSKSLDINAGSTDRRDP